MTQIFNAGEVFEMAIKMEKNGAAFYRQAAEAIKKDEHKRLLLSLAEMEVDHEKTFNGLRQELGADNPDYFDPDGEAAAYLKSIVDTEVFFKRDIDLSSMKTILREAIMAEKDSVVFYLGIKAMVPDENGKKKVEAIIKEEMGHIRLLSELLKEC
jgi:rubrerythrin